MTEKKEKIIIKADVLEIGFSPNGHCADRIIRYISMAKKNIRLIAYAFNNEQIAKELIKAYERKVDVRIITDAKQLNQKDNYIPIIKNAGVTCYKAYENTKGCLHSKSLVIDNYITITGSFNFTNSADKNNAENIIVLRSREIAKKYIHHFNYIAKYSG